MYKICLVFSAKVQKTALFSCFRHFDFSDSKNQNILSGLEKQKNLSTRMADKAVFYWLSCRIVCGMIFI